MDHRAPRKGAAVSPSTGLPAHRAWRPGSLKGNRFLCESAGSPPTHQGHASPAARAPGSSGRPDRPGTCRRPGQAGGGRDLTRARPPCPRALDPDKAAMPEVLVFRSPKEACFPRLPAQEEFLRSSPPSGGRRSSSGNTERGRRSSPSSARRIRTQAEGLLLATERGRRSSPPSALQRGLPTRGADPGRRAGLPADGTRPGRHAGHRGDEHEAVEARRWPERSAQVGPGRAGPGPASAT